MSIESQLSEIRDAFLEPASGRIAELTRLISKNPEQAVIAAALEETRAYVTEWRTGQAIIAERTHLLDRYFNAVGAPYESTRVILAHALATFDLRAIANALSTEYELSPVLLEAAFTVMLEGGHTLSAATPAIFARPECPESVFRAALRSDKMAAEALTCPHFPRELAIECAEGKHGAHIRAHALLSPAITFDEAFRALQSDSYPAVALTAREDAAPEFLTQMARDIALYAGPRVQLHFLQRAPAKAVVAALHVGAPQEAFVLNSIRVRGGDLDKETLIDLACVCHKKPEARSAALTRAFSGLPEGRFNFSGEDYPNAHVMFAFVAAGAISGLPLEIPSKEPVAIRFTALRQAGGITSLVGETVHARAGALWPVEVRDFGSVDFDNPTSAAKSLRSAVKQAMLSTAQSQTLN